MIPSIEMVGGGCHARVGSRTCGDRPGQLDRRHRVHGRKHEEHAREAARQGAKVIGFQEVFNAPYFCQVQEPEHYRWAEPVPDGPTVRRMRDLARETGMVIVVPVFEVEQSGFYYNTAAVIDADGSTSASTASTTSRRSRASGRSTTSSRATSAGPSSTRPSARSASTSATTGTSPRAGGARPQRRPDRLQPVGHHRGLSAYLWKLEQPAAAVANEYFVAAINRVGIEEYGDNDFYGTEYFVNPRGQFVGDVASDEEEELIVRDLDFDLIEEVRQTVGVLPGPPPRRVRRAGAHRERDLHARHRGVLPDWLALYYDEPIELTHGEGRHVWDAEGNRYLDFFGGILTTMTAHACPRSSRPSASRPGRSSTLHALPEPPHGRAGRADRRAVRHPATPRSSSPPRAPRPTRRRCCSPRRCRRSNQVLALRNSYHGRSFAAIGDHRQPRLVARRAVAAQR